MAATPDTKTLSLEYEFPHPPAKVWRALTERDLLARWLMSNDMNATVGASFTFSMKPVGGWDGIVRGEVLESEPPKRLSYTWRSAGVDTVVTWTLAATSGGGTKLSLEQSGVPSNAQAFEGARHGWQHMAGQKLGEVLTQLA
jgi:uncharacterized protein YndB with AHSA1/START domain